MNSKCAVTRVNTGIGDAVNLAWKVAAVVHGRAAPSLLESYEPERIAFARRLVATTDRAFTGVTSRGPLARMIRLHIVPLLIQPLFAIPALRRFMFRGVSQTSVNYRRSSLSEGHAGTVHGGDRLPWVNVELSRAEGDNFAPLTSLDWQVHVYGEAAPELHRFCHTRTLALHEFPWRPEIRGTGLRRDALYLIRPDGYIALVDSSGNAAAVASYLDARKLLPAR